LSFTREQNILATRRMLLILVAETTIRLAIDEAVKSNSFWVEEYNFRIVVRYALEEMRITYVEVGRLTGSKEPIKCQIENCLVALQHYSKEVKIPINFCLSFPLLPPAVLGRALHQRARIHGIRRGQSATYQPSGQQRSQPYYPNCNGRRSEDTPGFHLQGTVDQFSSLTCSDPFNLPFNFWSRS